MAEKRQNFVTTFSILYATFGAAATYYRVFKLGLYENKRLLGHQKCTFKS
jgi:hypothetical protein